MKNQFTVRIIEKRDKKGNSIKIARIVSGPKRGQCFSRKNVSEFNANLFWQAMEQHFGGRCFKN